ncbi:MAG: hypothetical protein NZ700_16305 [Gemmataceae bacterium]|nr:hypothetical protein [Gemmataceae bacterium]MDW8265670.1 hypothetical protein [Gemmataceae bacterium]
MSELMAVESPAPTVAEETSDLLTAIQRVLERSEEPLTPSMIRSRLPVALRNSNLDDTLQRQVTANVLYQFPKYRSSQERYWHLPMREHVVRLIRAALAAGPLGWSELRRKVPAYAHAHLEEVVQQELSGGRLFRHPRGSGRGERFGLQPADPKPYVQAELATIFHRLEGLGFTAAQVRVAALELLHDEEWAPTPPEPRARKEAPEAPPTTGAAAASEPAPAPETPMAPSASEPMPPGMPVSEPDPSSNP